MPKTKTTFRKGEATNPGQGRSKGYKNALTKKFVEDLMRAYDELGGVKFLVELGKSKTDRRLLCAMLQRTIPTENSVNVASEGDVLTKMLEKMSASDGK